MKISIFITSYNQKTYLTEAIESALNQSLRPFQIIIVDDCSTDGSQDVIAAYHSRFPNMITPIYHRKNTGVAHVRIDALNAVTGDFVTYMDGDDRFLPTKLEKETKLLQENSGSQIAFSNNYYMTKDGLRIGLWIENEKPPEGNIFCQTFARDFPKRSLFRMELVNYMAWKSIGFHDPQLDLYEDYDMRIRLTKYLTTVYYDEPLSEIRLHNKGLSKAPPSVHFHAIKHIFKKNTKLLIDLDEQHSNYVKHKLCEWILKSVSKLEHYRHRNNISIEDLKDLRSCANVLREIGIDPWTGSFDLLFIEHILSLQDLSNITNKLKKRDNELRQRNNMIREIQDSWGWKITIPLRKVQKILQAFIGRKSEKY